MPLLLSPTLGGKHSHGKRLILPNLTLLEAPYVAGLSRIWLWLVPSMKHCGNAITFVVIEHH
jgi:hypothetical protein